MGIVGMGTAGDGFEMAMRASASMTRAKTKITILIGLVRPRHRKKATRVEGMPYLLIHASLSPSAEHCVAAYQPSEKGVVRAFSSVVQWVQVPDEEHGGFVYCRKVGEIAGMLAGGSQDEADLFAEPGRFVTMGAVRGWEKVESVGATYDPERKRNTILEERLRSAAFSGRRGALCSYTKACGKRTLAPYTAPLRAALTTARRGARSGFVMI